MRLRPTHLFTTSDFYSFATRQVDAQKRPMVVPYFVPGWPVSKGADDGLHGEGERPQWSRFSGSILPGGVVWMMDDCIPTVGTTNKTQLIVSAPEEAIVLAESAQPIISVFPQTKATELQVVINARAYVAAITRHSGGTATISGTGYLTTQV